jgi:hypothetical protein
LSHQNCKVTHVNISGLRTKNDSEQQDLLVYFAKHPTRHIVFKRGGLCNIDMFDFNTIHDELSQLPFSWSPYTHFHYPQAVRSSAVCLLAVAASNKGKIPIQTLPLELLFEVIGHMAANSYFDVVDKLDKTVETQNRKRKNEDADEGLPGAKRARIEYTP